MFPAMTPGDSFAPGTLVGGAYRVEERIGGGGMGAVYRARRMSDGQAVAMKIVRDTTPELVARLEREARLTGSLDHPNLVRVHDVLRMEDGSPVVVMELLHGETLGQRLRHAAPLSVGETARIGLGIAAALEAAHAQAIVHRDLKPDNVFLTSVDGHPFVKVLDFGIAKTTGAVVLDGLASLETRTGQILGTPQYMAPEQIFGENDVDHRADLWALGVVLYESLSGTRPFDGANVGQVFKAIALDPPVPLGERRAGLPAPIVDLVTRLLAHARDARVSRIAEVRDVLAPFATDGAPDLATAPTEEHVAVKRPRGPRWVVPAVIALTAGLALGVWLMREPSRGELAPVSASATIASEPITTAPTVVEDVTPPLQTAEPPRPAPPRRTAIAIASASAAPSAPSSSARGPRAGALRRDEF